MSKRTHSIAVSLLSPIIPYEFLMTAVLIGANPVRVLSLNPTYRVHLKHWGFGKPFAELGWELFLFGSTLSTAL